MKFSLVVLPLPFLSEALSNIKEDLMSVSLHKLD